MSWWNVVPGLARPAKELVEVFKPNAEQEAARSHVEHMALSAQDLASLQQFTAEFHPRPQRTWWDSFMDGLNRLPRPLMTLGILGFFVLAPLDPLRFMQIASAYEMMPDGFWALLGIVVAFYFGGRMQVKQQDMAVRKGVLTAARELMELKRELGEMAAPGEPAPALPDQAPAAGGSAAVALSNRVVEEWRRRGQPKSA
jgi:Holin of 3TMs, for gene-transfer release